MKRVFSIRCFGDSKHFERVVETRLLRILKKYLDCDDQTLDEQLLNLIGIVKYPEQFEFCGPLSLNFPDGKSLDFSNLKGGSTVYGHDMTAAQITLSKGVRCILSIENKANYFDYIGKHRPPDELVIYHGSFSMLARLHREISASTRPYRMNKQELVTFAAFTTLFSLEYSHKLHELTTSAEPEDCSECIAYMLECCVRLEQEGYYWDNFLKGYVYLYGSAKRGYKYARGTRNNCAFGTTWK